MHLPKRAAAALSLRAVESVVWWSASGGANSRGQSEGSDRFRRKGIYGPWNNIPTNCVKWRDQSCSISMFHSNLRFRGSETI